VFSFVFSIHLFVKYMSSKSSRSISSGSGTDDSGHRHSLLECAVHGAKGAAIGFFCVVIPLSIKKRKLDGTKTGLALAIVFGGFRVQNCAYSQLFKLISRYSSLVRGISPIILRRLIAAVSGFISTVIASTIDPSLNNSVFIIWLLLKTIRTMIPNIPGGSTLIMCVAASQLLSQWWLNPRTHSPSYRSFLVTQSGRTSEELAQLHQLVPIPVHTTCEINHPEQSHLTFLIRQFIPGLKTAIPLYLPVHLFGQLTAKKKSLAVFLENVIRSSVFLALYGVVMYSGHCFLSSITPGFSRSQMMIASFWCGLTTLIERESRRAELAHYCTAQAINCFWRNLIFEGKVRSRPWVGQLILSIAVSSMVGTFEKQPAFIMKNLFGLT